MGGDRSGRRPFLSYGEVMRTEAATAGRLADIGELFGSGATTRGCQCMWFLLSGGDVQAGWGEVNRGRFERMVADAGEPAGVVAYADGRAVGWCAAGPRSRFARALRSPILSGRDPGEDGSVWLVPCFFVRSGSRRAGLTERLLTAAVDLARQHGATAVEGFPLAGTGPHRDDRYLGSEPLFAACGFDAVARPSGRRVVMRKDLRA
jgi:GNAT superfamily N-acetyltransferase